MLRFQRGPEALYRVPQLIIPPGKHRVYESLSQSNSTDFGQHSLRSSNENQSSVRGFNPVDRSQELRMRHPQTILEDSKEEEISFNKTLTGTSPIQKPQSGFENKSSAEEGTRSLIVQLKGPPSEWRP
mmetsp:Transcript_3682/g.3618  ORF Transcript_3682/g.3618 Transcript_3682/m.3618 type:complete len:128 (+) Transcript_3682:206-589(+)